MINTGNQTVSLDLNFDTTYTSVNATTLQNDDPNAFNWITNQTAVVPRTLNGTQLPQKAASPSKRDNSGCWHWQWNVPVFSSTVLQFNP